MVLLSTRAGDRDREDVEPNCLSLAALIASRPVLVSIVDKSFNAYLERRNRTFNDFYNSKAQ